MVPCKHCNIHNTLDSTFCKRCGTALDEQALKEARERLETTVAEGTSAFNEGRTLEAMAVAQAAVAVDPSSTAALSLKAMCHERRGEVAEALECAERIVELNPDSELDKIRRNALRNALVARAQAVPAPPDRRTALVVAVSAAVLVACAGAIVATLAARGDGSEAVARSGERNFVSPNPSIPEGTVGGAPVGGPPGAEPRSQGVSETGPQGRATERPETPTSNAEEGQVTPERRGEARLPAASRTATGLPRARVGVMPGNVGLTPIAPELPPGNIGRGGLPDAAARTTPQPSKPAPSKPQLDPDPTPTGTETTPATPKESPGVMEITISKGGSKRPTGGSVPVGMTGREALTRAARQQYQLGNYASSAAAYERAIKSGGDTGTLNQRLGQAYERLGRTGDAAAAYERAARAHESALASGKGDKERTKAALDSCRQALKVLKGG